jgi:hypothetical protein
MVPLTALLVPILAAAVLAFVASFVFHMVLPFHRKDWLPLPAEKQAMDALRPLAIPPGDYMMPSGTGPASMKDPAFIEKMKQGPVAIMTVLPSGPPTMGRALFCWFLYCVAVMVFAAYVAGRALGPGAPYLEVFRFVGTVAFTAFTFALWQQSIWFRRAWRTTILATIDGLIYALLAAGVFGWLWPKG